MSSVRITHQIKCLQVLTNLKNDYNHSAQSILLQVKKKCYDKVQWFQTTTDLLSKKWFLIDKRHLLRDIRMWWNHTIRSTWTMMLYLEKLWKRVKSFDLMIKNQLWCPHQILDQNQYHLTVFDLNTPNLSNQKLLQVQINFGEQERQFLVNQM